MPPRKESPPSFELTFTFNLTRRQVSLVGRGRRRFILTKGEAAELAAQLVLCLDDPGLFDDTLRRLTAREGEPT